MDIANDNSEAGHVSDTLVRRDMGGSRSVVRWVDKEKKSLIAQLWPMMQSDGCDSSSGLYLIAGL